MKRNSLLLSLAVLLLAGGISYGEVVYDFDNGNVVGSPYPGTALGGQDGWVIITNSQTARNDLGTWNGFSGNCNYTTSDSQASRLNDQFFQYKIVGSHITLEYRARISSSNGCTIALGGDANGDGKIAGDEVGFQFGYHQNTSVGWYVRQAAFGGNVSSGVTVGATSIWRIVLDVDLAANSGDGAGTLSVQRLSDNHGNPDVGPLTTVVENADLKISRMNAAVQDPATWNGIYTRIYGASEDNLTIRGDGVAVVSASNPNPSAWSDELVMDPANVTLTWRAGSDPNNWSNVNPAITEHLVYIRDASSSDPNLYLAARIPVDGSTGSWNPAGQWELQKDKIYYWRVDERLQDDAHVIPGYVWKFKTETTPPIITGQPEKQFVKAGSDAVFTVTATNPVGGSMSYEWHVPSDAVVGGDSPVLTISNAQISDEGDYYCVVTNTSGSTVSDRASLTIARLIGQWFVNGDPNDVSGEGNNAVIYGGPSIVDGPLAGSQAIKFNGSQYATVTITDVLNKYKDAMSLAFWLRNDGSGRWARFINYGFYQGRMDLCRYNNSSDLGFRYANLTGGTFERAYMGTGQWNHFVAIFNGTGIYLYKNGRLVSSPTPAEGQLIDVLGEPIVFGARIVSPGPTASSFSKVTLADVRAYNYALSDYDVAKLYTGITGTSICLHRPENDISGPDGLPDCVVDMYDFAALASEWLTDNTVSAQY